jgi:uncharacterized membrane protein
MAKDPTAPPPRKDSLSSALTRNIATLKARRDAEERARGPSTRFADAVTRFAGSMVCVYVHAVIVAVWVTINAGLVPSVPRFDESFVILATAASVEAIFLSTFVLISQNKMAASADKRADLDLQISLLTEHELTKVAAMLAAVMDRLGMPAWQDPELHEITRDVAPEAVLDELEEAEDAKAG